MQLLFGAVPLKKPSRVQTEDGGAALEMAFTAAAACIEPETTGTNDCKLGFTIDVTDGCVAEISSLTYTPYSNVTMETKSCITDKGYAFREAIIDVANELGIPADCHAFHATALYPYKCAPAAPTSVPPPASCTVLTMV